MKFKNIFVGTFCLALLGLTLAGCKNDEPKKNEAIAFSSNIESQALRVQGNDWEVNDAINVVMLSATKPLATENIIKQGEYHSQASGSKVDFLAKDEANKLFFPAEGNVDFIAYYPQILSVNNFSVTVDGTQDVLYSNNLKNQSPTSNKLKLQFKHALSSVRVILQTEAGAVVDKDATVTLKGINTKATFNLSDGSVTSPIDVKDKELNYNPTAQAYDAIVVPQTVLAQKASILITYNGKDYLYQLPATQIEPSKRVVYTLKLREEKVEPAVEGQITDWEDVIGGADTLDPNVTPKAVTKFELATGSQSTFVFEPTVSKASVTIDTDAKTISATSSATWLSVNVEGRKVLFETTDENTSNTERVATITITHSPDSEVTKKNILLRATPAVAESITLTVTQKGKSAEPVGPIVAEPMITAYACGAGKERYLKISNRSGEDLDLSNYSIALYIPGWKTPKNAGEIQLYMSPGRFVVYCHREAAKGDEKEDFTGAWKVIRTTQYTDFYGATAIAIMKDGKVIDVFGIPQADRHSTLYANKVFYRREGVKAPNTTFSESEWQSAPFTTDNASNNPGELFTKAFTTL